MNAEYKFSSDVDNLTDIKDVRNYMIGPVFGHDSDPILHMHPKQESEP